MISKTQILSIVLAAMLAGMVGTASANQVRSGGTGWQTAPGMMNNQGMGPGTMGPGMMGELHPGMMGPGTLGGYCPACGMRFGTGAYYGLELNNDQRDQIAKIERQAREKQWKLMSQLRDEQYNLQELYYDDTRDPSAINSELSKIDELQRQMFEANLAARSKVEALLTPEQRERVDNLAQNGMIWRF